MFRSLEVSNFQSLEKVSLDLAPFTVIVGPSNSGKSAVLRALKAAVRNVSSPAAVRVGHKQFSVRVDIDSGAGVAIERGPSHSTYRVFLADGDEEVFTKAGRSVPDEVQRVFRLPTPDGPDLAFSSQIDPPFLLAESGSTAAKMLGDLTNVSKLHAAAKEANRRRLGAEKDYKIRSDDARGCMHRLRDEFSNIREQVAGLAALKEQMASVRTHAREVEHIRRLLGDYDLAATTVDALQAEVDALPESIDLEDQITQILDLKKSRDFISSSVTALVSAIEEINDLVARVAQIDLTIEGLAQEHHDVLVEAGTCPTCGSEVAA